MNLTDQINAHFRKQNATPLAEFSGLSPDQMQQLLYDPLGPLSPVRLRETLPAAVLDQVPFLRLTEEFLRVVQREGSLKLTPLGALPRKYLHELYGFGFVPEPVIEAGYTKLTREQDSVGLTTLHISTTLAGLIKKISGKLTLTAKGARRLLPEQRPALLRLVLATFTDKFNWAYHDGYPSPAAGQLGWAYSVYLLARFGAKPQPAGFYADKYRLAFPFVLADFTDRTYSTPEKQLVNCYCTRVFERALNWFGLVEVQREGYHLDPVTSQVKGAALLAALFEV